MTDEKKCERCGNPFIPTLHKRWQRFCKPCSPIQNLESKKKKYKERRIYKTTVYLTPKEKHIIKNCAINLSQLIKQTLKKYEKLVLEAP